MKIIIAGGRDFKDYERLRNICDFYLMDIPDEQIEVVSGTAVGADTLGERFAEERDYPIKRFPADWNKHGKSAGYIRNKEMAKYSHMLIAFWSGESKGTKLMIKLAQKEGLNIRINVY